MSRLWIMVVLPLALGACQPDPPPEDDLLNGGDFVIQTPGAAVAEADVGAVIEHFKANGISLGRVDIYTVETDPASRLGRPNQYIAKAVFQDSRFELSLLDGQDAISFQRCGGIVEVFANDEDLELRRDALEVARLQFPAAPPEYQFVNGIILVRLGSVMTPDQANQYGSVLSTFET